MTRARDVADTQDNLGGAVPPFAAGKNKIINGDFGIWQRGTTINIGVGTYWADRWTTNLLSAVPTGTLTRQTFTPGTAPVAGYEGTFFGRVNVTANNGNTETAIEQRIEDVRTLAGQTATVSFWAKADATTPVSVNLFQVFGTGGSAAVSITGAAHTLTTAWQRFTTTVTVPSISGKTIGTGSSLYVRFSLPNSGSFVRSGTYDFWGVQLEAGSIATPFQTASGSIGGELALCQRYYQRITPTGSGQNYGVGFIGGGLGDANLQMEFPVEMRTRPTALEQSGTATDYTILNSSGATALNTVPTFVSSTTYAIRVSFVTAGVFTASSCAVGRSANANAFLGWSAEL